MKHRKTQAQELDFDIVAMGGSAFALYLFLSVYLGTGEPLFLAMYGGAFLGILLYYVYPGRR